MTGAHFYGYWADGLFPRQMLVDIAKTITRTRRHQAELLYRAWMHIADLPDDKTEVYYFREGYRVMRHYYEVYLMDVPKVGRWPADDKGVQRVRRFFKKRVVA